VIATRWPASPPAPSLARSESLIIARTPGDDAGERPPRRTGLHLFRAAPMSLWTPLGKQMAPGCKSFRPRG
jgi:hypothetical protein